MKNESVKKLELLHSLYFKRQSGSQEICANLFSWGDLEDLEKIGDNK